MPDKVWFSTTNWNNKQRPAEGYFSPEEKQAEWDAYNSSKFNGFPFPTVEKNEDNEDFEEWDRVTYFTPPNSTEKIPSKYENRLVSVLGDHYSYKFTFSQLFRFFWGMKKGTYKLKNECENQSVDLNPTPTEARSVVIDYEDSGTYGTPRTFTLGETADLKSDESKLVTELDTNFWKLKINFTLDEPNHPNPNFIQNNSSLPLAYLYKNIRNHDTTTGNQCVISVDFTRPVLKTGENEYRPFFYCDCCQPPSFCDTRYFNCSELTRYLTSEAPDIVDDSAPISWAGNYWRGGFSYWTTDPSTSGISNSTGISYIDYEEVGYVDGNEDFPTALDTGCWNKCKNACSDEPGEGRDNCLANCDAQRGSFYERDFNFCVRFLLIKVTKDEEGNVEREFTEPCGGIRSGGSLQSHIQNHIGQLPEQPGCYLYRVDFNGYKGCDFHKVGSTDSYRIFKAINAPVYRDKLDTSNIDAYNVAPWVPLETCPT